MCEAEGDFSWSKFFRSVEVRTEAKAGSMASIGALREAVRSPVAETKRSRSRTGDDHCRVPLSCGHWGRCTVSKPVDWVRRLPNLTPKKRYAELKALGVELNRRNPGRFPALGASDDDPRRDAKRQTACRPGSAGTAARLRAACLLSRFRGFWAGSSAVSRHPAVPGDPVPMVASPRRCRWRGQPPRVPRRRRFGPAPPVCRDPDRGTQGDEVANPGLFTHEQTRLADLADAFPDLARPIGSIVRRLRDLLPVVRGGVYHPGFGFSNSIKNVAPLLPRCHLRDWNEIADGEVASTAFWLMASGRVHAKTSAHLRHSLRVYCNRDTWAMVRLHSPMPTAKPCSWRSR